MVNFQLKLPQCDFAHKFGNVLYMHMHVYIVWNTYIWQKDSNTFICNKSKPILEYILQDGLMPYRNDNDMWTYTYSFATPINVVSNDV